MTLAALATFQRDYCLRESDAITADLVRHLGAVGQNFSRPPCASGARDYLFDFSIEVLVRVHDQYPQPWDGGPFELFFDAAIPALLEEAKFVTYSIIHAHEGNFISLAVGIFKQSAGTGEKLVESARLFREVRGLNREVVERAVSGAVAAIEIQQAIGERGSQLPLLYHRDLLAIADPLMYDSQAWTVDADRKLRIVSELVLIRSVQLQGRDISNHVETLNRLISEYEGTPISVWDAYANRVTFGLGGTRTYGVFSRDVAIELGLLVAP